MKKKEFSFMYNSEYKKVIESMKKGLKQVRELVSYDSKEERINSTIYEITSNLKNDMQEFVKNNQKRINQQKEAIEKSYAKSRNVYENPTEELLRRQDFDMEIASMSEDEILDLIQKPGRTFTSYELNKIYSLDVKTTEIKTVVKRAINENRHPYLKDLKYQKLLKEEQELSLIDTVDRPSNSILFYVPSNNQQGYTTIGLSSLFIDFREHELNKKIDLLTTSLEIEPSDEVKTFSVGLGNLIEEEVVIDKPKKVYEDFDSRIFKGASDFNVSDRFKYLKERFNDKTTDRFDITKDSYNISDHMDFLEGQHAKKMASDVNYREAYQNAENAAIKQENGGSENE
ncbi:hypothetical protein [Enterococcus sp. DIV0098]|uniref:hypothetical protein n=1 Tax=Enterococcus sp. DIV0098 TaxID=2774843 RepID=UPI003F2935DB